MPLPHNPTAPRKKYALAKFIREYNAKHSESERITYYREPGEAESDFNPDTEVIGQPARETLKKVQRVLNLPVSGNFDHATMLKLLPPGIRGEVMARAHAEVGSHEWPPGSNRGEIVKYLNSVGLSGGYPWCAAFVTWVLKKEGLKRFPPNPAYVPSWGDWARQKRLTKPMGQSQMGDLWCWNWNGGALDHIGFCDEGIRGRAAWYVDGNVGDYGGSVTDSARPASGVALVIDLVKLAKL